MRYRALIEDLRSEIPDPLSTRTPAFSMEGEGERGSEENLLLKPDHARPFFLEQPLILLTCSIIKSIPYVELLPKSGRCGRKIHRRKIGNYRLVTGEDESKGTMKMSRILTYSSSACRVVRN